MKFCITGWRGHTGYIVPGLKNLPDFELAGAASGEDGCDGAYILEHLRTNGITASPKLYSDWMAMLDEARPDVISADGPYHLHGIECLEAAKRGIHVFCEKPISLRRDELAEIERVCAETGTVIVSMVGLRYDAAFRTAHRLVREGAVGKIKMIHAQKSYRLGTRPDFYKKRELYGGTIPWVGSHAIDWILWFAGSPFESVTAYHDSTDNFGNGTMEIAGKCLFRLKNGVIASADIDFLRPAAAPTHGDDRIRIAGTEGVIEVMNGKIHLINASGDRFVPPENPPQSLFEDFIGGLRGGNPLPMTTADTIALTRACLLARESADLGKTLFF